ncbi:hypothetical protein [Desulfitobacterium dehalogenans]|uniref:hypothetical protein n=1 Tax=Desulfitobacterium dehalogenans TaxID=36854 RepID=UPI0005A54352|nr:hypothetical protein [Desulfitobacterium dehalogenans]
MYQTQNDRYLTVTQVSAALKLSKAETIDFIFNNHIRTYKALPDHRFMVSIRDFNRAFSQVKEIGGD